MASCETLIKKSINESCPDLVMGLEQNAWIINRADVDIAASTFVQGKTNILKTIALIEGAEAYKASIPGKTPFTGTSTTLVAGTYQNRFTNTFKLVVLDNSPEVCEDIIDGLANGSFVVVYENKYKGTDLLSAFQVFGFYNGLYATEGANDKYAEETEGGWSFTLVEEKAPKSGLFLQVTAEGEQQPSYEATKDYLDSLVEVES